MTEGRQMALADSETLNPLPVRPNHLCQSICCYFPLYKDPHKTAHRSGLFYG